MADLKVHILDCGAMHSDKLIICASPLDVATRSDPNRPHSWHKFSCHCVLIEHPDGRMLWDTAPPRDWEERWGFVADFIPYDEVTEEQYLDSRLDQLGVKPADIDTVALSHLHLDHAGNARQFAEAGARLITHEKEVEYAHSFDEPFSGAYFKADYEGLEFETVSGDTELYPGITLLEVPGHSPGTMALRVDLPETGTMIFTSDAVDSRENYGPPALGNLVGWSNATYVESVERIRGIAEETDATVVFSHDLEQLASLKLAPDSFYT